MVAAGAAAGPTIDGPGGPGSAHGSAHGRAPVERSRQALDEARGAVETVDLGWLGSERERVEWALADDTLRFVTRLVELSGPSRVVEFGSGLSTRVLAAACAGLTPPGAVVSLETDPHFAPATTAALAADGSAGAAAVCLTHLVVRRWFGRNLPVYALPDELQAGPPAQLVLVDGPPLPLGGREGSLLQALHLGEAGTIVLLDDTDRSSERAALARAQEVLGDAVEVVRLDGFAKGLAAVVLRRPIEGPAMPDPPPAGPPR